MCDRINIHMPINAVMKPMHVKETYPLHGVIKPRSYANVQNIVDSLQADARNTCTSMMWDHI